MISVEGLEVAFGARFLFKGANFTINRRDRIALVGRNGAGKSTLLKVLCGIEKASKGNVSIEKDIEIGYLPQIIKTVDSTTVRQETRKVFAKRTLVKEHIERLNHELSDRKDYESDSYIALTEELTRTYERYNLIGGGEEEAEMERTLIGLGFSKNDFDRPTSEFSGGWRMRIELAKLLLSRPDVLLLDEPTNHLDIESIQWLERFLALSHSATVLVSHDRAFINNVTNRTLEITCGRVDDYNVKYDEYIVLRQERIDQQRRAYNNQQREISDIKDFIERFRYKPTKAVQVQSRIKQLAKIVPIVIDDPDTSAIRLKFPKCQRSGDFPIICTELEKDYGTHNVLKNVNLTIKRGEKVAFVGKNGEGKTTLVKCIMGQTDYKGSLKIGHNVQIGYFAQNQAQLLNEEISVRETIDNAATGEIRSRINDILGAFMFGGEEAEKYVKVLSGGERSRLAMIKLLLEPVNLLILDEPTNHLDMASKDVLKEALKAFDGTIIVVSHDREFLDSVVSKVYVFANATIKEHIGGIYDYLCEKDAQINSPSFEREQKKNPIEKKEISSQGKQQYDVLKEQNKGIKRIEKSLSEVENAIMLMEKRLKEMDNILCLPENSANMELINEYVETKKNLDKEMKRWEELSEKLEKLREKELETVSFFKEKNNEKGKN